MKTLKLHKVLIALDYDPSATKVAEIGYAMAKSMGAKVLLLHVIADSIYYSSMNFSPIMGFAGSNDFPTAPTDNSVVLKDASLHFLDKTRNHLEDTNIQTMVADGDFADSIIKTAKKEHVDVIVMGSHSRRWLDSILLGSVTEKVIKETAIPLFIVPIKA
jgi:nucleotide-binding universal stress UspA family protein